MSLFTYIYIIKELVLKQCSKFYASGGNIAKRNRITGLPKNGGGERELKIRWGGDTCKAWVAQLVLDESKMMQKVQIV
jgi:hypothetical protein